MKGCGLVIEGFQDFASLGLGDGLLPLSGVAPVPVVALAQFVRGRRFRVQLVTLGQDRVDFRKSCFALFHLDRKVKNN